MSDGDRIGDKAKGVAKEALGSLTGDEDKEREGEQQQKAAQKGDEAERLEAEAQRKRDEASGHKGAQTRASND